METIYWIQRLGTINTAAWVIFCFLLLGTIVCALIMGFESEEYDIDKPDSLFQKSFRLLKKFSIATFLSLCAAIFVPTKDEAYAIYGIGGTIDYLKSNDTARQLPDKVVNAIDAWLDEKTDNNKEK